VIEFPYFTNEITVARSIDNEVFLNHLEVNTDSKLTNLPRYYDIVIILQKEVEIIDFDRKLEFICYKGAIEHLQR